MFLHSLGHLPYSINSLWRQYLYHLHNLWANTIVLINSLKEATPDYLRNLWANTIVLINNSGRKPKLPYIRGLLLIVFGIAIRICEPERIRMLRGSWLSQGNLSTVRSPFAGRYLFNMEKVGTIPRILSSLWSNKP